MTYTLQASVKEACVVYGYICVCQIQWSSWAQFHCPKNPAVLVGTDGRWNLGHLSPLELWPSEPELVSKAYNLWIFAYVEMRSRAQEPLSAIAPSKDNSSWRLALVFCVPLVLSPGDGRAPSLKTFLILGTSEISDNVSSSNETEFPWTEVSRCVATES